MGTRTSQEINAFSDVDLVIMSDEDIPVSLMAKLTLAFEWHILDEGF